MTVISAILIRQCTAISSDSLITEVRDDGSRIPVEWEQSKVARIPKFRGSASYWGLATYGRWSTFDWLQSQARVAEGFDTLEEFARSFRQSLENELAKLRFRNPIDSGIGIHLTGYEHIDGYWIPELLLCSNFADPSYSRICCLHLSRETFHTLNNVPSADEHREPRFRLSVKDALQNGAMLIYNNGDPLMFNPSAKSFLQLISTIRQRGLLNDPDSPATYRSIARRPIEIVSAAQQDFCRAGTRFVGGRIHDLVVTPAGEYSSTSGD